MINVSLNEIKSYSKIFIGAKSRYGVLTHWNKETGEKTLYEEKEPIPIEDHLNKKKYLA